MNTFHKTAATLAGIALSLSVLSGCSTVEQVVTEQVGSAACTASTAVVDEVATQISESLATVSVDPQGALVALEGAQGLLDTIAPQLDGEAAAALDAAGITIDQITELINDSITNGGQINQAKLDELIAQLTTELNSITKLCQ